MNKCLHKFMEKPDISDKPDKWDGNLENMPGGGPDKPDRLDPSLNLSGLSGGSWALLEENLRNIPEIGPDISDNTDKPDISDKTNSGSYLSGPIQGLSASMSFTFSKDSGLLDEYEERIAIAEYDGHQTSNQAERIAYLDAFIAVLATLPNEDVEGDWLAQRIRSAHVWLLDQGMEQPK